MDYSVLRLRCVHILALLESAEGIVSSSGRTVEFMRAWRDGKGKPHGSHDWGQDGCDACVAEMYDEWQAFVHAAEIAGFTRHAQTSAG